MDSMNDPMNETMNEFAKRTVIIGDVEICYPAFVTLLCGLIVGVLLAANGHIILGIFTFGMFLVTTYNVNCVVVGNCTTWAWILMFIYIFYVLTVVGAASAYSDMKSKMIAVGSMNKSSKKY